MDHPDWPLLLNAILANPDDDTVRLVAADFLDENGDPDRAAFIRVQCALARLAADGRGQTREADELRQKEHQFLGPLATARVFWAAEACPELVRVQPPPRGSSPLALPRVEGVERLLWRRGFVDEVWCPAADWLRHGTAIRRRHPIRGAVLRACAAVPRDEWYARLDALRGLPYIMTGPAGWLAGERAWLEKLVPGTRFDDIPF
ncbi:MAG: TIGR02996 domain-containing protein [Gemmataceae bacterium]|nr:TIGR02996 domain-containing protein [Gemmataceae bacterium]